MYFNFRAYRSDTEIRVSSAGKRQGCFFRAHLLQGSEPEHFTFMPRHRMHLFCILAIDLRHPLVNLRSLAFL